MHLSRRLRNLSSVIVVLGALCAVSSPVPAQTPTKAKVQAATHACPDNDSGLALPAGFCATVFADGVGHARHMVVAPNGVLYINTWSGRYYGNDKPHAEWATRLMFAHDNAVENLVIFAPLVLILAQLDYSTQWTALACAVYFWARVAHLIVYTIGLPVFRTLAFTVGFLAQAVLALAIFKVL